MFGCVPFSLVKQLRHDGAPIEGVGPAIVFDASFGGEQGIPEPELLQATGELRWPADAARCLRAVDTDVDCPTALVLS